MISDFINAKATMAMVNEKVSLHSVYGNKGIDWISRFGGLDWRTDNETLYDYYLNHIVEVNVDKNSSIVTLTTRAFKAEDALQINKTLIQLSEWFVNNMNEQARQDSLRYALEDVKKAEDRINRSSSMIKNYRTKAGVLDPVKQSELQLGLVNKLQDELVSTKLYLSQIMAISEDSPQMGTLKKRIETLNELINAEMSKVVGGKNSFSNQIAAFDRPTSEWDFAEKQYAYALMSLDQAQVEARNKQLYLIQISKPTISDRALEPYRARTIFTTAILSLLAWGIFTVFLAGVKEHKN